MHPRLQAETSVALRSTVWRTSTEGTWTVATAEQLLVLDLRLEQIAAFPLPGAGSGVHAVTPDSCWAALSLPDRVTLVDQAGVTAWETRHPAWADDSAGSTWITPDGLVWAVVPGPDGPGTPDHWWVIDLGTGKLLADLPLDGPSSGSEPLGHPGGVMLAVSGAGADDRSRIYHGGYDTDGVRLRRMPGSDRVLADVHRLGDRYLTTDRHHEDIAVHALDDGSVVASRPAEDVFGPEDLIDFHPTFVTDDRVVVRSVLEQQHLVLDAATLAVLGPLEYPDDAARDAVMPAGDGSWVTTDWLDGRVQLWTL